MSNIRIPHFSHRRSDDLQRVRLRIEDEAIRAPVARDLEDAVLVRVRTVSPRFLALFWDGKLTGACIKYEYFNTSANKKLSCTLRNDPPFATLTSEMAEKPWPVLVVAFMARKASHAQSWYIVLPWFVCQRVALVLNIAMKE